MDLNGPAYRVMSRRSALFLVLVIALLGVLVVVASEQAAEAWIEEFQVRLDADPELAATWLRERLFHFFLLSPVVLTVGALLVVWQGVRTVQTGCSPPAGWWIVRGQRTHVGHPARIRGHLQWLLGLLLIVVSWGGCWYAYRLVDEMLTSLLAR